MAYGLAEVSYESCVHNLTAGAGRSIAIVIGGASEALEVSCEMRERERERERENRGSMRRRRGEEKRDVGVIRMYE